MRGRYVVLAALLLVGCNSTPTAPTPQPEPGTVAPRTPARDIRPVDPRSTTPSGASWSSTRTRRPRALLADHEGPDVRPERLDLDPRRHGARRAGDPPAVPADLPRAHGPALHRPHRERAGGPHAARLDHGRVRGRRFPRATPRPGEGRGEPRPHPHGVGRVVALRTGLHQRALVLRELRPARGRTRARVLARLGDARRHVGRGERLGARAVHREGAVSRPAGVRGRAGGEVLRLAVRCRVLGIRGLSNGRAASRHLSLFVVD